ncbi:MAG: FAD-dependent oxidoreductase [Clostridiales bacterium]|nr:FAD-dependent oxidoreductase [Clostridiales bacterium]
MKKWRCTVCGYVHEGDAPPETCPVCGAAADQFVELDGDGSGRPEGDGPQQPEDLQPPVDVVVVGSGAAAFSAAVTARRLGLSVVMLEKAEGIGGTTVRSGGGFWIPANRHQRAAGIEDRREDALRYMARYAYPHLYSAQADRLGLPEREYALICAYCDHAARAVEFLEEAGVFDTVMEVNWTGKPQVDYMDHLPENRGVRGRPLYTADEGGKLAYGHHLIARFADWAGKNGIDIRTGHEVTGLLRNGAGEVCGVEARHRGQTRTFAANKGVIFGSGGFSHNPAFMLRFQRGPHYGGCSAPTNTGDFIKLAGGIGAAIGNTAGAFRAQSMIEVYLANPGGSSNVFYLVGDSMLVVNKYGRRTMNEKRNYTDRAMTHFVWDPVRAEWTNMLQFIVFDARTAKLWQGFPPYPVYGEKPAYLLSADSLEGLEREIAARLARLAPHTGGFALAEDFGANLQQTVRQFNAYAEAGKDPDFGRGDQAYDREWTTFPPTVPGAAWPEPGSQNHTMHPLSDTGPYFAILVGAGTLDTNGGPLTDGQGRVLDWQGAPIPGLYGAGNCVAAPSANAYWGGGTTIGAALTFGHLAARHAAARD